MCGGSKQHERKCQTERTDCEGSQRKEREVKFSPEQLEARRKGIGASEAAAVLGLSKWRGAMEIYLDKIGVPNDVEESEPMYWGTKKEPIIRERFAEDHRELVVIPGTVAYTESGGICTSGERDFIFASPDALLHDDNAGVTGKIVAGLEIKTATQFKANDWPPSGDPSGVPVDYWVQCQQCMYVTGLDKWWLAVLIGSADYREYLIERDQEFIDGLVIKLTEFWKLVEDRTPPPFDESDASKRVLDMLYPAEDAILEPALGLPSEADALALSIISLKTVIKETTSRLKLAENTLKGMMGDNALGFTPSGYEVGWKPVHKEPYEVKAQDYRVLSVKKTEE